MNTAELIRLRDLIQDARRRLVKAIRLSEGEALSEVDDGDRLVYCALVRIQRAIEDAESAR